MRALMIFFLLLLGSVSAFSQRYTIRGTVTNPRGTPIAGVVVSASGTVSSVRTDSLGNFSYILSGAGRVKLEFSHTGFIKQYLQVEPPIGAPLRVVLAEEVAALQEVVISTGYQKVPRERLTGSFTVVSEAKLSQQVGTDVLSRLEGVANGIVVDRTTTSGRLMVRGLSTISGPKDPLIVVDNFPYDGQLDNINPNDVESVTILKDAAAASIWGARAANGVIVITTRSAKLASATKIAVSSSINVADRPDLSYLPRMSSADFIGVERMLYDRGYYAGQISSSARVPLSPVVELLVGRSGGTVSEQQLQSELARLSSIDVRDDFTRYMYSPMLNTQHTLSFSGGSEKVGWYGFAGYDRNRSNLGASYARSVMKIQQTYRPLKALLLVNSITYTDKRSEDGRPGIGDISVRESGTMFPYAELAGADGSAVPMIKGLRQTYIRTAGEGKLLDWQYYPMTDHLYTSEIQRTANLSLGSSATYQVFKGGEVALHYRYEREQGIRESLREEQSFEARNQINRATVVPPAGALTYRIPRGGILNEGHELLQVHNLRAQFGLNREFGRHALNALIGGETKISIAEGSSNRFFGYDQRLLTSGQVDYQTRYTDFVTGAAVQLADGSFRSLTNRRFASLYANAGYEFDRRYSVSLSARRDASNLFGLNTNDQWNPFWSAGLGWNVSNMGFYDLEAVPYLKLRATYGFSGNVDPSMVAATTITYLPSLSTYTMGPTARISNFYNPELKWETSKMLNVGVDFRLGGFLQGSAEYYHKKGVDLFGTAQIDYTSGVGSTVLKNVASMSADGVDVELSATPIKTRVLSWQLGSNLTWYKDRVLEYYVQNQRGSTFVSSNSVFPISGVSNRPVYGVFGYRSAGLDPLTGEPRGYLGENVSKDYSALMGTGVKTEDLRFFGSSLPTFYGSINNGLSCGGFTLNVNVLYKFGYYIRKNSVSYTNLFASWEGHSDFERRWQKPGDEGFTSVPALIYPAASGRDIFYQGSEDLVLKGDHVRLQYINLSYTLDRTRIRRLPFQRANIALNASNLGILWRANDLEIDPDANNGLNALANPKSFALSLKIDF